MRPLEVDEIQNFWYATLGPDGPIDRAHRLEDEGKIADRQTKKSREIT